MDIPMSEGLRLRILVVDASPISAIVVAAVLETAGHVVFACGDASAALQEMTRADVDAVVLGAPDPHDADAIGDFDAGQNALAARLRTASLDDRLRIVALRQQRGRALVGARVSDRGAVDVFVARPLNPRELLDAVVPRGACDARRDEDLAPADLDFEAFQDLVALGGTDFAQEILDQFVADGARLLAAIARAAVARDSATFREEAHALRSCAANVGARGVYGLCLEWREASASDLGREGAQYVQALEREFTAASAQLRRRLDLLANDEGATGGAKPAADGQRAAG